VNRIPLDIEHIADGGRVDTRPSGALPATDELFLVVRHVIAPNEGDPFQLASSIQAQSHRHNHRELAQGPTGSVPPNRDSLAHPLNCRRGYAILASLMVWHWQENRT
jgi:hypothetical protein